MSAIATTTYTRKRTYSFSTPSTSLLSTKKKRTGTTPITKMGIPANINHPSLKRTELCRDLPLPLPAEKLNHPTSLSYNRTLRHYKEQRDLSNRHKQRKLSSETTAAGSSASDALPPPSPRPQYATLSQTPPPAMIHMPHAPRTSSPLSPTSNSYQHCNYRRSTKKAEPDLYKQAIFTRMRCSPEGARILHMGPRLALSIMEATKDLERLAGSLGVEIDPDSKDVYMSTQSWLIISGDQSEWEMISC